MERSSALKSRNSLPLSKVTVLTNWNGGQYRCLFLVRYFDADLFAGHAVGERQQRGFCAAFPHDQVTFKVPRLTALVGRRRALLDALPLCMQAFSRFRTLLFCPALGRANGGGQAWGNTTNYYANSPENIVYYCDLQSRATSFILFMARGERTPQTLYINKNGGYTHDSEVQSHHPEGSRKGPG